MTFATDFEPGVALEAGHWVVPLVNQKALVRKSDQQVIYRFDELTGFPSTPENALHLGLWRGESCFVLALDETLVFASDEFELCTLRSLLPIFDDSQFTLVSRALQLLHWQNSHRFCGCCSAPTQLVANERALACTACGTLFYPRISPCVIGVIVHHDRCLLARNARFGEGRFSTIAGFIEPGETAEAALRREIKEEVGVEVGELEYISSQPWPFPSQLMLGFVAHYTSGEIRVDGVEIVEANWFHADNLPQIPPPQTISGLLITTFLNRVRNP